MIRIALLFILAAALATSCTERIDVKVDSTYTRLTVDGSISNDSGIYTVSLSKSADYFSNEPVPRVTGASVYLSDGENIMTLHETKPGISGIYATDSNFSGTIGKKYTISIELPEEIAGHSDYEASCEMRTVPILDSVAAVFHPEWGPEGVWTVRLWAQEPGDEVNFYMFNLYRNGKLLTDTITKKSIADDKYVNGSYMRGVDVVYLNNAHKWETIYPGDTVVLEMSGITSEYHTFISQVSSSGFNIPFFTGPPSNIVGNVSNGGIGFFAAYSSSFGSTIVPKK